MDDLDIEEFFAPLGPVTIRRMFGGKGIYFEGRIVAIDLGDEILLKADETTAPRFAEAGATQWRYAHRRSGEPVAMPYWTVPDAALDDADDRAGWLGLAAEAAMRADAPRKRKR